MKNPILKLIIILPLFLLLITPSLAFGKPENNQDDKQPEHSNIQRLVDKPTQIQNGLMKSCQAREGAIKNRMDSLTKLATNMEIKFSTISARVETYYTDKVVPSGKTVSNYDSLISDIQAKKDAVNASISTAQSDVNGFSCDSTDPKADLTKFREDMQMVKSALKEYRTSIKNLIVAVRSVVGEENKETETPTP